MKRPFVNPYHKAPGPTFEEIQDYAAELAKEQGAKRQLIDLIYYPTWCDPCPTATKEQLQWAKDIRAKAANILHKRADADKKKNRYWTNKATKHGQTPPSRKRGFILKRLPTRRTLAPPGGYIVPEPPVVSPSRPERRVLLLRIQNAL